MAFSSFKELVEALKVLLDENVDEGVFTNLKSRITLTMESENNPLGVRLERVLGDYYYSDFQLFCIFNVIICKFFS